jgi:arsenate reductase-like glutaredoxin family protein
MKRFHGIEQKKTERKTKEWLDAKLKELPKVVKTFMEKNPTQDEIETFYTSYVMRYTKDSIEDILRDYNTFQIETTAEIVDHFGNFFKPNK